MTDQPTIKSNRVVTFGRDGSYYVAIDTVTRREVYFGSQRPEPQTIRAAFAKLGVTDPIEIHELADTTPETLINPALGADAIIKIRRHPGGVDVIDSTGRTFGTYHPDDFADTERELRADGWRNQ